MLGDGGIQHVARTVTAGSLTIATVERFRGVHSVSSTPCSTLPTTVKIEGAVETNTLRRNPRSVHIELPREAQTAEGGLPPAPLAATAAGPPRLLFSSRGGREGRGLYAPPARAAIKNVFVEQGKRYGWNVVVSASGEAQTYCLSAVDFP